MNKEKIIILMSVIISILIFIITFNALGIDEAQQEILIEKIAELEYDIYEQEHALGIDEVQQEILIEKIAELEYTVSELNYDIYEQEQALAQEEADRLERERIITTYLDDSLDGIDILTEWLAIYLTCSVCGEPCNGHLNESYSKIYCDTCYLLQ